jgi:tetratricopeptide (TPR) repeat protein
MWAMSAVVIFVVAMAVRLLHVWFIRETPMFDVLMGDARAYDQWALRIAGGDWIGSEVFYQAPLYPYFLGTLYAALGHDLLMVRVVQAIIGSASAVLLADAGERLFSRRVGLVAGFALALYAPAIFFDGLLQKTVLDVFFVCLTIWLASRLIAPAEMTAPDRFPQRGTWLALGAALGALSLTRENALALVLVAVAWAFVAGRPARLEHEGHEAHEGKGGGASGGPAAWAPAAALLAGLAIVLVPVAARNYTVGGGFYLTTSQFGPNFYIGNNPESDGTYMSLRRGRGAPEYERQDAVALAERALGRTLTPAEVSGYWTDRALGFITEQPLEWIGLMLRKTALLFNTSEMLDTESQETYEDASLILRVLAPVGHFGVLVPFAAIGLVAAWPDRRRLWPILAMLVAYAASVIAFYVFARYRFPMVPLLVLLAAVGVVALPGMVRAWPQRTRVVAVAALVLLVVWVNRPLLSSARMRAITETNLGVALHEAGRYDEAVTHYRAATDFQPDYAPAYNNLGVSLKAQGKMDEAIAVYEQGLALRDAYPDLHYNLANALIEQNRSGEAAEHLRVSLSEMPGSAAAHNNLGMTLASQGRTSEAAAEFRAAIAASPGDSLAHRNLGNLLATAGRREEAIGELQQAARLAPQDPAALYDLGIALLEAGRPDEAATRFRAALALDPDDVRAINNLGIALASQGRIGDAIPFFERALQIQPGFEDAKRNLELAREAVKP